MHVDDTHKHRHEYNAKMPVLVDQNKFDQQWDNFSSFKNFDTQRHYHVIPPMTFEYNARNITLN